MGFNQEPCLQHNGPRARQSTGALMTTIHYACWAPGKVPIGPMREDGPRFNSIQYRRTALPIFDVTVEVCLFGSFANSAYVLDVASVVVGIVSYITLS